VGHTSTRRLGSVALLLTGALACTPPPLSETPCNADRDCMSGAVCRAGVCEPGSRAPVDAGVPVDAGAPLDAGVQPTADAGGSDDAGAPPPDAGQRADAGRGDEDDAGDVDVDAGYGDQDDAGAPTTDAGSGVDAGYGDQDDAGVVVDAGPPVRPWLDFTATHRMAIQIDNTDLTGAVTNAPIPIRLGPGFPYASVAPSGSDLRAVAEGPLGFPLPLALEVERWQEGGESVVWVRFDVPEPPAAAELWLYWGGSPVLQQQSVWDADARTVFHMSEPFSRSPARLGNAAGGDPANLAAEERGTITTDHAGTGILAGGVELDGAGHFDTPVDTAFRVQDGEAITVESWFKIAPGGTGTRWLLWSEYGCRGWSLGVSESGSVVWRWAIRDVDCSDTETAVTASASGHDDDQWHYTVGIIDRAADVIELYVDGDLVAFGATPGVAWGDYGGQQRVGNYWNNDVPLVGELDEARVSRGARSADWIRLQYASVAGGAVSLGPVELRPGDGGS
jgi:hypothetical protein